MKVKKDIPKIKKKKNKLRTTANPSIKKVQKNKVEKVDNKSEVAVAVKKEFKETEKEAGSKIPLKQQTWLAYLKVFSTSEKLTKKQQRIMEFCTTKSLTPPKRKQKFLNFIRNCYQHQKEVTDEVCFELFDSLLEKYNDYKDGKYSGDAAAGESSSAYVSKNKKKKLDRLANNGSKNSVVEEVTEESEGKWEKIKSKKRTLKVPVESSSEDDEMETDDDDE